MVAWWYFSDLVVVTFSRPWGRWPQAAVLVNVLAFVAAGLVFNGSAWSPGLAWSLFIFTEFFFGLIGLSFLFAAIFAVPG